MEALVNITQSLYELVGIQQIAGVGDTVGLGSAFIALIAAIFQLLRKKSAPKQIEVAVVDEAPAVKVQEKSFSDRLFLGLARSREEVWGKMAKLFSGQKLNQEVIDQVEELLYSADLGPKLVAEILEMLEDQAKQGTEMTSSFKDQLYIYLKGKMETVQLAQTTALYTPLQGQTTPRVIMIVGVNGAGKTTTIGKIATKLTRAGSKVVVGACDTFRAAAVDQLQVWCDRAQATMIRAKEGANPSGVGFDALQEAIAQKADYCLLDTAGRLHTKDNLMEELKKSKNVLAKLLPDAPHEVLLVIDAITGQNALRQAQEFHKTLGLTGLIFTKCDGSSKAGSAISIVSELGVPLTYIGVGEGVEDLDIFNLEAYLKALIDV